MMYGLRAATVRKRRDNRVGLNVDPKTRAIEHSA
jgi:hypothetical protein